MSLDFRQFTAAARARQPRIAFILGSGLGDLPMHLRDSQEMLFRDIPDLEAPSIAGHRGTLVLGNWSGHEVLVFAGRLHAYEGYAWQRVVQSINVARQLGAQTLVLTNAAGGIRADLDAGDLMVIHAHLDWTRHDFWRRADVHCADPYAPELSARLERAAARIGCRLTIGVYAQVTGPSYETAAEIRALRACGADAVGMSTAREAETAAALGMRCAAIACITNKAAGLTPGPVTHAEVLATAARQRARLGAILKAFLLVR